MLGVLLRDGMEVTNNPAQADVVIVNTCSFIDAAQEESVDAVLQSAELREAKRRGQGLVVAGCLPQRYRDELPGLMPEVDAFMGIDQVEHVTSIVRHALDRRRARLAATPTSQPKLLAARPGRPPDPHVPRLVDPETGASPAPARVSRADATPLLEVHRRPTYIPDYATPRFRLTPRHFAYLKVAEGCGHPCSFCIIPQMRGAHRSRPQSDVVQEARALLADGVKELNLISQDTTYYGLDLHPRHAGTRGIHDRVEAGAGARSQRAGTTLCTLLRELDALPGDFWIRLLYTHPAHWTDELIATIAECPKVVRYIDLPLQHIHDVMLERMRRETSRRQIEQLISKIRTGILGITLRTTFIVGFPGETEACYQALLEFIRQMRFERVGVFTFSREDGTRAARMDHQIPDVIKRRRRAQAMAEQRRIAREVAAAFVGRTIRVLVEREGHARELSQVQRRSWEHGLSRAGAARAGAGAGRFRVARGAADAPDIDGRVYVHGKLPLGEFAQVRIVGHTDYDLIAEPES